MTVTLLTWHPRHCAKCSGKPTVSSQHPRSSPQALFIMLVSSSGANCLPIIPFKEWNEGKQRNVDPRDIKGKASSKATVHKDHLEGICFSRSFPDSQNILLESSFTSFQCCPPAHIFFYDSCHTLKELTEQ